MTRISSCISIQVFSVLTQLGVGPAEGFRIEDDGAEWSEFLQDDFRLEFVKTYIYLKVRLAFDPPLSSAVIESINRQISELEWRINVSVDPKPAEKGEIQNG